jgi:hypothetical protein
LNSNSLFAWENLLLFAYKSFNINGYNVKNLTSKIKNNIASFSLPTSVSKNKFSNSLGRRIEAKVNHFDIKGAVKILSSDDKIAPFDDETFLTLRSKHGSLASFQSFPNPPENDHLALIVNESNILKSINSFPCGSAPGIDGMRPQFLKDMVSFSAGEAGGRALAAITRQCNFIFTGKINKDVLPIFYGASLCALLQKHGGIRPIAIGSVFRRLAAKVACSKHSDQFQNYFSLHQLAVGTQRGCESAIHAVRTYVNLPENNYKVVLKVYFANAFNSIKRGKILTEIKNEFPLLYPFLDQSYRQSSSLFFGEKTIPSEVGVQRGDPCGPMTFSATIQPLIKKLLSELNVWYLDDATLADKPEIVLNDLYQIINLAAQIGLNVNTAKYELFFCFHKIDEDMKFQFETACPDIRIRMKENLELLGIPIFEEAYGESFGMKEHKLSFLCLAGSGAETACKKNMKNTKD